MPRPCLLLPHGAYSLLAAALTTMGWIAALFDDNCNYAKVTGLDFTGDNSDGGPPYLQVGLQAYRAPTYNVVSGEWEANLAGTCVAYPESVTVAAADVDEDTTATATATTEQLVLFDTAWNAARALQFLGLVLGGGATFYLWISTCCKFSRGSWRWAGYEVAAASLFQALSFVWFGSNLCRHKDHTCALFVGAKADILASVFWLVAALLIFCHYPAPKELLDSGDGIVLQEVPSAEVTPAAEAAAAPPTTTDVEMASIKSRQQSQSQSSGQASDEHDSTKFTIDDKPDLDDVQIT